MNLIKLSLNCIISTIIYSYLRFFSWEVTKTACQVGRSRKIFRTCKGTVRLEYTPFKTGKRYSHSLVSHVCFHMVRLNGAILHSGQWYKYKDSRPVCVLPYGSRRIRFNGSIHTIHSNSINAHRRYTTHDSLCDPMATPQ